MDSNDENPLSTAGRLPDSGSEEADEPLELPARDPDEVLAPPPFRDPNDFAPLPPPRATVRDVLELGWHIAFVLLVTVVIPLALLWTVYRLYRWLPMETMAMAIAGLAAAWAYRDKLGGVLRRVVLGGEGKGR